jgi:ribose transport system permease protein
MPGWQIEDSSVSEESSASPGFWESFMGTIRRKRISDYGRAVRRTVANIAGWDLLSVALSVCVIAAYLGFTAPAFLSLYNLDALGFTLAITGLVALAQVFALAVGQFNLALTGIGVIVGMLSGWLMQAAGLPFGIAIAIGIAVGVIAGSLQGLVIAYTGINPFLVSLAMASMFLGGTLGISQGDSYNRLPAEFVAIGRQLIGPVPLLLLISVVVFVAAHVLMDRTVLGRQLLATGASNRTTGMSGIDTKRTVVSAHTLSGFLSAVAGVMLVARLGSAQPSLGNQWLLPSFAAPVLGGTLLSGGKASIPGALLGTILLSIISNGLQLHSVNAYVYQVFLGLILLAALAMDRARLILMAQAKPE